MVEFCLSAFSARYSHIPLAECVSASEAEVSQDLDAMQMQFDIMKQYRRYVIIRAETDDHLDADRDGVRGSNLSRQQTTLTRSSSSG
jgi:hypothetical protein